MRLDFYVSGMHCHSCEQKIIKRLSGLGGVKKVRANSRLGHIWIEGENVSEVKVQSHLQALGFKVVGKKPPLVSRRSSVWRSIAFSGIVIFLIWYLIKFFGVSFDAPLMSKESSFALPLLAGLTAGFSTCAALLGGYVVASAINHAEKNPKASMRERLRPQLIFNAGRLLSFAVLGGLLGSLGSYLRVSGYMFGVVTIIFSLIMLTLGLSLTEIFPRLKLRIRLPLPRRLKLEEGQHHGPFMIGSLSFFIPCGFTQAMQLYAITTGSFFEGALVMTLFALGTAPALIGLGGAVSFIGKTKAREAFFRFVGVLIILFSIYGLLGGFNLMGAGRFIVPLAPRTASADLDKWGDPLTSTRLVAEERDGQQTIKAEYTAASVVQPENFEVKAGTPVRFEIFAHDDGEGCMGSVLIPGLYDRFSLFERGKAVVMEFTPTSPGRYLLTCAMGIPAGTILVR